MIHKHLLVPDRVRRPPAEGFSWVDRRFLRDFAAQLSGDAVFLYFFLAAVSDRQGLSFYNDSTLACVCGCGKRRWSRRATNWWFTTWWRTRRR
jgi:hypothetical protein